MEAGKVSIIIPAYNCGKYLAETLDSVRHQTYNEWECIIVDDGSTDNTKAVALAYCSLDKRISYHYQENQGPSVARNTAVYFSNGEFILPVDGDDLIAETYIERAVNYFKHHPETTLVTGKVELFGEKNGPHENTEYNYENAIWCSGLPINSSMYRRSDFDRVGGYNPNMKLHMEDFDFWISLLNKESVVHRIDEVMLYYRINNNSRSSSANAEMTDEMYRQIQANHPEIYSDYTSNIIPVFQELHYLRFMYNQTKHSLDGVLSSHAYKIGKTILKPITWIRYFVNR